MEKKFTLGEWHAIDYAGYLTIQKEPYYETDDNLLHENKVGSHEEAIANALLMSKAPLLLQTVEDLLKSLQELDWPQKLIEHLGNQCMNAEQLLIDATTL